MAGMVSKPPKASKGQKERFTPRPVKHPPLPLHSTFPIFLAILASPSGQARRQGDDDVNEKKKRKLLTYAQVSEETNLPLGTLYHRVAEKKIPHLRLGRRLVRFDADEVAAWLKAQEVAAAK
jgi:excisionase family DNA binding protein